MSSTIFGLDIENKTLARLQRKSMSELGLSEPYDLEAWLASTSDGLFDRKVLWIARQDRPSDEQRSDLIGASTEVSAWRSKGQSYECRIKSSTWIADDDLRFSVLQDRPRLFLIKGFSLEGSASDYNVVDETNSDGHFLEFSDVDVRSAKFSPSFGERLIKVVIALRHPISEEAAGTV